MKACSPQTAFTLIELMVAVTIMMLMAGGGVIYLNNFNSRQKLASAKSQVVSALKMAQDYAKTKQLATNATDGTQSPVRCVAADFTNNKVSIHGETTNLYFIQQQTLGDAGISVATVLGNGTTVIPCFAIYEGKLVDYATQIPFPNTIQALVSIKDVNTTATVVINPSGVIDE